MLSPGAEVDKDPGAPPLTKEHGRHNTPPPAPPHRGTFQPSYISGMSRSVELARQQWATSYERLLKAPSGMDERVSEQMETVTAELRRRVGGSFTLTELAATYEDSERWTLTAISERCSRPGWIRTASSATDAAFHLYARGARDYRP